jgi:hypothetical protein
VSAIEASDASLVLTAAQAVAFETAHIALSAPSGDSVSVSETAAHLQALTAAQIKALEGAGITALISTNGAVKFSAAQTIALEGASVTVSALGASVTLSDTAANLETLTASEIDALPTLGFSGVRATNAGIVLTVAQAFAFEMAGFKIAVPAGDKIVIADTAAHVAALTAGEIAGLPAIGVTQVTTTNVGVTLSVAQALALETGGVALSVPTGGVAGITDEAANIETLTVQEVAGLTKLHVTRIAAFGASVTLGMAQALALATAGVKLSAPNGDSVDVAATAAAIEALTTVQIAGLGSSHVSAIEASDASLVLTAAQAVAFETAHIALSAPSGDSVSVSDTAAHLQALTAAEISGLPKLGVAGLNATNANVMFSAAQTSALMASGSGLSASETHTIGETFTNGAAIAFGNDGTGGGDLTLTAGKGLIIDSGASLLSVKAGSETIPLTPNSNETITATGRTNETFVFASDFGNDTIKGFAATGSLTHDLLQFNPAAFGKTSANTQAEDFAALLAHTTQNGAGNAVIADGFGDMLTIAGVSLTTLTVNPADFKFV